MDLEGRVAGEVRQIVRLARAPAAITRAEIDAMQDAAREVRARPPPTTGAAEPP